MNCVGWPDQPCAWQKCLDTKVCQNPGGPTGPQRDFAITPGGEVLIEIEGGARIVSAELSEENA